MLQILFGSKSLVGILLFLFVNEKCYGLQLKRALKTSLTPIQKALQKLEKGGVILSFYEGKTRLYQFNPAYPLMQELEQLLKKAYTLLPPAEKKSYYLMKEIASLDPTLSKSHLQTLLAFWDRLSSVTKLTFNAKTKSKDETGWHGKGKGEVDIARESVNTLVFNEKGTWQGKEQGQVSFSNVFRWTLDRQAGMISLEHLRRDPNQPVLLFYLVPSSNQTLSSVDSYLCEGDIYFGQIHFDKYTLRLNWRVIGAKKNEEIDYFYH